MTDAFSQHKDLPPISKESLKLLFDFIDTVRNCNHTFEKTIDFLKSNNLEVDKTLTWLGRNGAGCDCEVGLNVEAEWGELVGRAHHREND